MRERKGSACGRAKAALAREDGQALIELYFSLALMVILLIGAVEFGKLAYMAIEISDAAKAAAQYGSQSLVTGADTTGIQLVAQRNAPEVNAFCSNFTITPSTTCACVTGGTAGSTVACSSTCTLGYLGHFLTVYTTASCNPGVHLPGTPRGGITLRGRAIQEILN